ncbi:A/G-specific adenine glycosylase [Legionella israelensis]|uniref:Adenine DNA glycosylase n=1 Tax=Legionella israelensis TaxID=454 RepID=A0A0W0W1Z2_9GAMM|nr:A/G-specific adenine glycosylase [Legionella israelensis]KTD26289.1 A/G specific adenine glycosylase [Legionella israelensis]QBS10790.1 A/G-specific adenine glycosylase [Legionella israelensis]SCY33457.1 A/G-specific DNA-adenine glycosylase [Legionella israelensis DSM 19235]STX57765.1 A/G-specific adenine glycosylase [Legionella israelensis]
MTENKSTGDSFGQRLLNWFDQNGRKNLPWQNPREPYKVWLSEIMLQQTQVKTVIPYFNRFLEQYPSLEKLAKASLDEVLSLWSGLGYYSRGRNLHKTAKIIIEHYHGQFPATENELVQLPGIGPSTAAAIAAQAFNQPAAILDGNVKRVLSRYFQIEGWPQRADTHQKLLSIAKQCLPSKRFADYTQAIMDLGAMCCTPKKPACSHCPLQSDCLAYQNNVVNNYPNKKPRKKRPIRYQQFLLLYNGERQIYLEKKPPAGLWGGLWCLPSIEAKDCPITFILKNYNFTSHHQAHSLMELKHSFSHFDLKISVKTIQINHSEFHINERPGSWFSQDQLRRIGLAKPISLILEHWYSSIAI